MKKNFKKFISAFLALVMVITAIPMSAYADESKEAEIIEVQELTEYRDEYSKTFETSEGTNVVISAAVPIHYENNGELVEIDNTLVTSAQDDSVLTNKDNSYNVELPKKYTADSVIRLSSDENEISFSLLNDVNNSKGEAAEIDKALVDDTNAESVAYSESNLDKLSSGIIYSDVIENTNIEYIVEPNQLKENIVINNLVEDGYSLSYQLDLNGLDAVKNDDNSISVTDAQGKEIYIIESPYMFDANGNVSYDIAVDLAKTDNTYTLTYTPDYKWLSSDDCAYPVTIDPTINIIGDKSNKNIEDTFVTTSTKTKNKSTLNTVTIQNSPNESWGYYNIKNLPQLPENAKISNCTLNLSTTTDVSEAYQLALYHLDETAEINSDYISKVNWNNKIDPEDTIVDMAKVPNTPDSIYFDITNLANSWYQNSELNRILVLKASEGTLKTTIASSEYTTDTNKLPYISLKYTIPNGINSDNQHHLQDAGLAGTAYINDYTGKLVIERTEFSSKGSADDIILYMGEGINTPENNCFGENISVNYYQTLIKDKINNNSDYILIKGDGTKECIKNGEKYTVDDSSENAIVISYMDGDDYISNTYSADVLSANANKDKNDYIYALTKHSVKKNADNNTSANDFTVTISYNDDKILSIVDEVNAFEFSYANGILNSISTEAQTNEDVIIADCEGIAYLSNNYIINENSIIVECGYNDNDLPHQQFSYELKNGNVIGITDETGSTFKYTYNDNNQIVKVQEFSADDNAGDYLTFDYGVNSTTISDVKNTYTEYFDLEGRLISIVDQDGNATFAQYKDNLISKISKTRNSARNIADFYNFESDNDCFFKAENGYVTISDDKKLNGNSSAKLTISGETETFSGRFDKLDKNSTYTISLWLYQDENTDCSLTLKNGDKEGIFTTVNSQSAEGWQQFYCTIDTENSSEIYAELLGNNNSSSGTANIYVDSIYIQKSPYLTNINLLKNNDFSDELNNWNTNSDTVSIVSEEANISSVDNNRLKITGNNLSENTISQTVPITTNSAGTKYTYSGWVKTADALPAKDGTDREVSLSVYNGNTLLDKTTYSSYGTEWQYIESELTLPDDSNYTELTFVISYNYQSGYALFDALSLSQDELYTVEFEGDEDNTKADKNSTASYEYDDFGNIIKKTETATVNDAVKNIVSKFRYGNNGTLLSGEMTPLGRWNEYKYDYFGNTAAVIDANGNKVQYEYDNFQNLSSIINSFENKYVKANDYENESDFSEEYTLKVQYSYTGNRLDKIETGNIENDEFVVFNTYAFEYDEWGNQINIFINDMENPYIHYEYDKTNYHQLNSVSYINGQEINYVYDDNGNIIYEYDSSDKNGDTLSYSYYYYDDGTCYGKKNHITGTAESYQDSLTTIKDSNGNTLHSYGYDKNGNLLEQIGNNYVQIKNSKNTIETKVTDNENNKSVSAISTEYDDFGRISCEKISVNNSSYILKQYTYYNNTDLWDEASSDDSLTVDKMSTELSNMMNKKELSQIDEDASETNLIRYLTYYLVNDAENTKVKLSEYRYLYYANGNSLSYFILDGNGENTEPGKGNGELEGMKMTAYNSANMEIGNIMGIYSNSSGTKPFPTITIDYDGFLDQYNKQGNISKITTNQSSPSDDAIDFGYDNETSEADSKAYGTALKNCLTDITFNFDEDKKFKVSYDKSGNINNVSADNLNATLNDNVNVDLSSVDLKWSRGSALTNISGKINVNYKLPLIDKNISIPLSLDMMNYKYDDNNLRTNKSVNLSIDNVPSELLNLLNVKSSDYNFAKADMNYVWRDGKLVGEEIDCSGLIFEEGNTQYGTGAGKYNMVILYDQNNNAYGFTVNKTADAEGNAVSESHTFYYLKDADNTINAIIDENGNKVVKYLYGAYGMVLNIENAPGYRYLAILNPLAYKDYVYDIESGMYYLQSRYYAPYVGRFISAGSVLDNGSKTAMCTNLYSYCENDPTNNVSPTGTRSIRKSALAQD